MITDDGKEIISKYLLGYVPAYASHIAIGCGARPRSAPTLSVTSRKIVNYVATLTTASEHYFRVGDWVEVTNIDSVFNGVFQVTAVPNEFDFSYSASSLTFSPTATTGTVALYTRNKKALDFEMARVPIVSKGFVDDSGTTKISLIAELPSESRYEITEIGLWSAANNTIAVNSDSHIIFSFTESWQGHGASVFDPTIKTSVGTFGNIDDNGDKIFYALSGDSNLTTATRKQRNEGHRFLSKTLFVRGDSCQLNTVSNRLVPVAAAGETVPIHVHLNNVNFDISNNSPSDLLSFAFCLVDKNGVGDTIPDKVKILIEFYRNEISTTNGFAKKEIILDGHVFKDNRYRCETFPISDLITSEDFSPREIRVCRIYSSVEMSGGTESSNHYLSFDGLRIDNVSTENPTYKMSGYSVVQDPDAYPITKKENTINYIEFRFNLGVT